LSITVIDLLNGRNPFALRLSSTDFAPSANPFSTALSATDTEDAPLGMVAVAGTVSREGSEEVKLTTTSDTATPPHAIETLCACPSKTDVPPTDSDRVSLELTIIPTLALGDPAKVAETVTYCGPVSFESEITVATNAAVVCPGWKVIEVGTWRAVGTLEDKDTVTAPAGAGEMVTVPATVPAVSDKGVGIESPIATASSSNTWMVPVDSGHPGALAVMRTFSDPLTIALFAGVI